MKVVEDMKWKLKLIHITWVVWKVLGLEHRWQQYRQDFFSLDDTSVISIHVKLHLVLVLTQSKYIVTRWRNRSCRTKATKINPLNPELNPICYLLAILGAHHFLHVSRIRVKLLTFRLLMSYIYIWSTHSWCF